jgi:hypothetical protein
MAGPTGARRTASPPGETDARIRDRFDSRTIELPKELGSIWFEVFDPAGAWAATATFAGGEGVVRCDLIEVERPHRRQGIATVVYMLASRIFDAPVVPASVRSDDAVTFWAGRTEIPGLTSDQTPAFCGFALTELAYKMRWLIRVRLTSSVAASGEGADDRGRGGRK